MSWCAMRRESRSRPTAEGKGTWSSREPKRPLIPLISMNCSHSKVRQKKGCPRSQRIPIRRWQNMSFIVPIESALPGGKSRVCALESPAVIRGRRPGRSNRPDCLAWIRFSLSDGRNQLKQLARGFSLRLCSAGFCPPPGDPRRVCGRRLSLEACRQQEGGFYAASLAGKPGRGPRVHAPGTSRAEAA
jgi:hypothetical protein